MFFVVTIGYTQLSDLHYLPPMKQGWNNDGIRQQAVYLSTPEPTTFTVNAYRGTNNTPIATFNISNVNPAVYNMSNGDNNIILVNNANTGVVLNNSGLRFEAPSGNSFYVNYRGNSSAQAASLTSKGRVAMGTKFKWGGVPNLGAHRSKSNTLGIMATKDNTTINLFGYDPDCEFRVGNNRAGITANTHQITLNANESFVYETYIGTSPTQAHEDGWIGASVVSDKDIVISNGSMNFGRQVGASNRDAGIDQPVPENRLGKEYVFVRGNGNINGWTEFPLVIGIADNTQIFVNGSATPIATINNGDYFQIPSNLYSSNTVGANMFVQTSKDVYAYQCLAGSSAAYTTGLNFVAPVNCLLPDVMDNIPDIRNMAGTIMTGGLTIIAAVNTPDANITITDDNGPVTLPASNPVAGSTDWKTFFVQNLNGNVSVQSTGPMAVGFFGFNGAKGVAGYFSGFDTVPEVNLEIRGGSGCFVGSEIYEATSNFDAYQWFFDGVLIPGANAPNFAPTVAGEYYVRGTKGPCTYDSNAINALYCDPDIIINKTVDKSEIVEGETATFKIHVRNLGVGPVTNLRITDNIPAGLTLTSSFTISGTFSGNTWNIGTLNGGETAELELEVQADEIDTLPLIALTNIATNSQDQTDANITQDNPWAKIIVHNDFDKDGIIDTTDLDDDNDGIYDTDECSGLSFNINSGNTHSSNLISVEDYLILDIFSLDNSFNIQINGTDIAGEIQFHKPSSGNFATFTDGNGYGENGIGQIWTVTGAPGSPILRVVVDQSGQFNLFGSRTSNGPLEPMKLTAPANVFAWNPSGNNNVVISQAVIGPTNMQGALLTAGCDTDSDNIPDHLDLDSDGDGCSDANEYYKDNTIDGNDGGEYGTGTPVVDPLTGMVTSASYIQVFAPIIELKNTTEDLGGNDINGQAVSLGQTVDYVLRFQNTGDDNATNYTIRNVLPDNVTLDNVDVPSTVPLITYNHDIPNNTLNFTIPNNLVEIGDPEYSIRITVTISQNCSDFVGACSSELSNAAYSTYQGNTNPGTFTDDNGINTIGTCDYEPQVTSNSLLNDLLNCNETRTVQLCGDDVILAAGAGFVSYNWVLDTNGNGQVDNIDTVLNDGDPDNDPSTLLVTDIGEYIVQKLSDGSCPDLLERISVERFGTTQTNPIIDYFNQVNSDSNSDNDMQGEIVTCSVDGDLLPRIFLCGANDTATIQLGITDAQSIVWQKLDETSCGDSGADCANKNGSCTWDTQVTQDNFTFSESGEYRVVINYKNGCFSRFYFNVFKNELDIDYTASDILCATDGNIRITNVGSGYGFQLFDVANNTIVVPFSANNGPNFDITNSGTYKVQITQLNPSDNTPIAGACLFETEDIGILEKNFSSTLSATAADCNNLGTISVQALNALPNYSYELYIDDGSNGGLGTLVSSKPTLNDNTHTFNNVQPNDYIVVTKTDDGCLDSQQITVDEITPMKLIASTSEDITCTAGIVNLTPSGGIPKPNYEMAIWSKNGVDLYSDPSNIPASAIQTNVTFLFGYRGTPSTYFPNEEGDYTFIVKDSNNCYAISNTVHIEDLGSLAISASHTNIICADSSTSSLTVGVTGGTAPYQYSLDGGTNYQTSDTFVNLPAGKYTITVKDSSGNSTGCIENYDYEIDQPFRLTASPAIIEDASCNSNGALVKILNANGGQAPYEYSFDSGSSFANVNSSYLLPGSHQLVVRDNLGCTFSKEIIIPNITTDPNYTSDITYDCDGLGNVTITPSNTTDFDYTYTLNGTPNTPANSNTFANLPNGTHTVTVGYSSSITPTQSSLFIEDFGAGVTTQIEEIGSDYCFEPQNGTPTDCNRGPAGILVNGEYAVTNLVTNPIPSLRSPNDHTGLTNGRFLAIDVSTFSDVYAAPVLNGILWSRNGIQVSANRDITFSLWAYNLMQVSGSGNNPEMLIELVNGSGTVIQSISTPEIPKNTNADDWHNRTVTFNPGANTTIGIIIRNNVNSNDGNDLIIDDIQASQSPIVCEKTTDLTILIEDNKEFKANVLSVTDPSCTSNSDGSIRFEVLNFDAVTGFEYSIDGGTNWTTSLVSPVNTSATLAAGSNTVSVRKVADNTCATDITATLTTPTTITPSLTQTADYTCFNSGATLEASATGGKPGYEYQLEDSTNTIITAYQSSAIFTNVPAGDYVIRVKDQNNCSEVSTTAVTVAPLIPIDFDLTSTACYDGQNNASVTATVNTGNGGYQFRIDGGAWVSPTPSTATTYTFSGLSNGSYDIEVRDELGCPVATNTKTIVISPQLVTTLDIVDPSACGDGTITINATGGNGTLLYAIVPANTSPTGLYSTTNTLTITNAMATANPSGYDVYVQDNNGAPALCNFTQEDIILTPAAALSVTATAEDPECFDGLGLIDVVVSGGKMPYTYTLTDLSPADGIDYGRSNTNVSATTLTFNGIGVGNYEITITDTNNCIITSATATINNGVEITADIRPLLPAVCSSTTESDYGFEFTSIVTPTGTVEYSNDGGTTWQASSELRGTIANPTFSGTAVFPSIRVEVSPGVYCQKDFDRYIIPFPLDDLDITLFPQVLNCNDLQVTVRGSNGDDTIGYRYTYTDDPANFGTSTPVWTARIPTGTSHTFANINPTTPQLPGLPLLVPGRTYVFYVEDGSGCIRQSNVNVNEVPSVDLPIEVTADITPTCFGATTGEITFTITPDNTFPNMRWEVYQLGNNTPIETSAPSVPFASSVTTTVPLGEGEYYIEVTQLDGSNAETCKGSSENIYLTELAQLNATAVATRNISCNLPGLIAINGISGGGGSPYTYDVSGPSGFSLTGTTNNPIEIPVNSLAGDYTVTLYDQFSCPLVLNTVTLTLAPNPTLSVSQDNCALPITITAVGSSAAGNLRYAIVPNGNGAPTTYVDNGGIFTNVSPGSYDVYTMDGNGCTVSETAFIVHPVLSASASLTKLLDCTASQDAIINIDILDGSGSYEYSITNNAGAPAVNQSAVPSVNFDYQTAIPGDYTITIYDTNTPTNSVCNRTFIITVPDKIVPVIDSTIITKDITCLGSNDGSITIATANGNAAPYGFEITSKDGAVVSILPTSTTGNSATFTNLAPTNTAAGYIVTVTGDAATNNCSVNSASITIAEPLAITFNTPTITPFGCSSDNTADNASIAIETTSILGGSGNYTRFEFVDNNTSTSLQDGTNSNYIFTDKAGTDVMVRVYDDKGCSGEILVTIPQFDEITTANIQIDDPISCSNLGEDIHIDVSGTITNYAANPANYEFRLLPSTTYQPANTFTNLQAGNYIFGVKNIATGCETTVEHNVIDPNTFDFTIQAKSNVVCFGDDGSVQFNITDATYVGNFTVNIYDTAGTPANTADDILAHTETNVSTGLTAIINVAAGSYLVEVLQDGFPECSQVRAFSIATPSAALALDPIPVEHAGCSDGQGSATIQPNGGVAPYNITITNVSTSITLPVVNQVNSHFFQNLTAGQYTVEITDALGCTNTFANAFEILLPQAISGTISQTGLECLGDTDGTVSMTLNPRNVTPNYTYVLNTYNDASGTNRIQSSASQTATNFTDLPAGFYSITVNDEMNCTFESNIIEIAEPAQTFATLITVQNLSCSSDAELELQATGGTAPYTWSADGANFTAMNEANASNTHLFQNVTAGNYQYYIRDSFNCVSIISNEITLNAIENLTVTLDNSAALINCNGENTAIIEATADGGLGNYQYALFTDVLLTNEIRANQDSGIFTDIPMGNYFVRVQSEDCQVISEEIRIDEPSPLVVNPVITNVSCNGENDGSITINASGGTGNYQYAISPDLNKFIDENTFDELAPDNYSIIVQDANGCFELIEFTIAEPSVLTMSSSSTPEICAGDEDGTISVTITGGTAPYSTSLNSNADADFVENRVDFNSLPSGDHVIFVKDANGCIINEVIKIENGANLNAAIEVIYECSGDTPNNSIVITLEDPSISDKILYGLDTDDSGKMVLEPNFTNIANGTHSITIAHANGCLNTLEFEIEAFEPLELNAVQENINEIKAVATGGSEEYTFYFDDKDNGSDNTFHITRTDSYTVRVVDKNGCEVITTIEMEFIDIELPNFFTPNGDGEHDFWIPKNIENFPNILIDIFDRYGRKVYKLKDDARGWSGFYEKNELPTGDYWYVIKLNGEADKREFIGHFTLYR